MNKWIHKFMEKPDISDKPDKPDISDKWDENLENMPGGGPDKPDRLDPSLNLSGLSGSPWGLLGENLSNMRKIGPDISDNTDKPDRLGPNLNLSGLSGPSPGDLNKTSIFPYEGSSLLDDYEERLAIAEYDGQQSSTQAQRIAYQDAFIAVLNTLSYEEEEGDCDEDWLTKRIKATQSWLVAQGVQQPE
jgi:hypothetical protein